MQHVARVDHELIDERLVEPEPQARGGIRARGRAVAENCKHRIDRNLAADEERDGKQARERDDEHRDPVRERKPDAHAAPMRAHRTHALDERDRAHCFLMLR